MTVDAVRAGYRLRRVRARPRAPRHRAQRSPASSTAAASCATSPRVYLSRMRRTGEAGGDPRDRPGHDRHHLPRLRPRGADRRAAPTRSSSSTSRGPGWVEHDAGEIWEVTRRVARRGARRRRHRAAPSWTAIGITNQRETVVAWDPATRRAAPPRAGLAGPPHRRALRRAARGRPRSAGPRAHRADDRPLLLGDQDRVAAGQRRGRRAGGLRHDRLLAAVQAHRPPRHRLLQRLADDALRHPPARLGRRALRAARDRPGAAARAAALGARLRHHHRVRRRGPGRGDRRRPAGGAVRPGLPRAGDGEEHLRHRQLRPAQHRRRGPGAARRPADHGRLGRIGGEVDLRARGRDLRHRRRGAVAARRARDHRRGGGDRGAGRLARLQRRRLLRAGADRARLAALGSLRARDDRRPHPRQRPRPPGAGGAGGDRLPDGRRGAGPGGGLGRAAERAAAPTAAPSPTAG